MKQTSDDVAVSWVESLSNFLLYRLQIISEKTVPPISIVNRTLITLCCSELPYGYSYKAFCVRPG